MNAVVSMFGLFLLVAGFALLVNPKQLVDWIANFDAENRFRAAVIVRVALGGAFVLAADTCRLPQVVYAVGVLLLFSAALLLGIGRGRVDAIVNWFAGWPPVWMRAWSVVAFGFGGLLLYAGV